MNKAFEDNDYVTVIEAGEAAREAHGEAWGGQFLQLTPEQVEALRNGKQLAINVKDEYVLFLEAPTYRMRREESGMKYPRNKDGKYVLTVWDLEELHFVAEDVIVGLRFKRYYFDDEGNFIMDKIPEEAWHEIFEKNRAYAKTDYLNFLENEELHRITFDDAVHMPLDEIKEKYLKDILPVARGILRKDTSTFADYFVVSDEVPDSYLDDLLALRWKENLKLWTMQWDKEKSE